MTDQPGQRIEVDPHHGDQTLVTHATWTRGAQAPQLDERVEFATAADGVLVRDPRYPNGPQLRFSPEQWSALLSAPPDDVIDARTPPDAVSLDVVTPDDVLDLRESSNPSYS